MKFIRVLLFPIVPIYFAVTWLRNLLYDLEIKKTKSYNFPLICVGNLSAGGTGKTPMVEYLIRLLKDNYNLATLSRGYGRKTKGFRLGNTYSTAEELGDEPFQFYHKFNDAIHVAVDENRQHAISILRDLNKKPDVIILDDAFQHRKVKAGLNILLTTYSNPFYYDIVLPTGNLREPRNGAKRAHIIIITKCPILSKTEKKQIVTKIEPEINQEVFFSSISYAKEVISKSKKIALKDLSNFTLVTGIANAKPLVDFLNNQNLNFDHLEYKDHHHFSENDIEKISKESLIITTEKDYVRLKDFEVLNDKLFYLPIMFALDNAEKFDSNINYYLKNN